MFWSGGIENQPGRTEYGHTHEKPRSAHPASNDFGELSEAFICCSPLCHHASLGTNNFFLGLSLVDSFRGSCLINTGLAPVTWHQIVQHVINRDQADQPF